MKDLYLEIDGETMELDSLKVLAVIPRDLVSSKVPHPDKVHGLNVALIYIPQKSKAEEIVTQRMPRGLVFGYICSDQFRIPIDLHGGNCGGETECYFGYINPTIFEGRLPPVRGMTTDLLMLDDDAGFGS